MAGKRLDNFKDKSHKLTAEDAAKGGKNSAQARREKANLRKCLEILLSQPMDKDGKEMTGAEALAVELFQKALKGDVKAFEVLRDTAGQKPKEEIQSDTSLTIKMGGELEEFSE